MSARKHDPHRHEPRAVGGILHTEPFAQGGILAPGGPSKGEPDPHPLERKTPKGGKRAGKPRPKRKRKRPAPPPAA